jgi:CDP-paratose 2-epimerase
MRRFFSGERAADDCRVLITGGAGFIGTNVAKRLLDQGTRVRILDSLTRAGSERNIEWLRQRHADSLEFVHGDIRNPQCVRDAMRSIDHVVHLAAQVAVTSSLCDPREDFSVNVGGTLNVLEAARACPRPPSLLFTSTNKVYGALEDLDIGATGSSYLPLDPAVRQYGVSEQRKLSFYSPYGCSKGAADQYVLDYARSFGLRSVVLRMSCIYGPHQNGTEDQGWVAHFLKCALAGQPLKIFGDGLQVRDVLFVEDLVDACELAREHVNELSGEAFNIGGGPGQALSLRELLGRLESLVGTTPRISFEGWRVGDQRYYVSDVRRFSAATGWSPRTGITAGLRELHGWLQSQAMPLVPLGAPHPSSFWAGSPQ